MWSNAKDLLRTSLKSIDQSDFNAKMDALLAKAKVEAVKGRTKCRMYFPTLSPIEIRELSKELKALNFNTDIFAMGKDNTAVTISWE